MRTEDTLVVRNEHLSRSLNYIAENLYSSHDHDYRQLANGPRRRGRKHATYEKILASFALEPVAFSLGYTDLIERVNSLRAKGESPIPNASINSALRAIGAFQQRAKMNLLEWQETEKTLYILEPTFLFYLRQKLDNVAPGESVVDALIKFLSEMSSRRAVEFKSFELGKIKGVSE